MKNFVGNILILLAVLGMATVSACGRKGALIPPEALVPAAVTTLSVQQQGGEFRIIWSAPTREQGGRPLRDLAGFQLLRRQLLPGEADCAACSDAWQLLAAVDLALPTNVRQSGGLFIYHDAAVKPDAASQYRLLALSRSGGVSKPVTSALKKMLPSPTPPSLKASVSPTAVVLELTARETAVPGFVGYNIYRHVAGTEANPLPYSRKPVTERLWEDQQLEYGTTYRYAATVLVKIGNELVESPPCAEVEVLFTQAEIR